MKRWNEEVKESECERIVKVEPRPSRCDKDNHFRNTNKNRGKIIGTYRRCKVNPIFLIANRSYHRGKRVLDGGSEW